MPWGDNYPPPINKPRPRFDWHRLGWVIGNVLVALIGLGAVLCALYGGR